MSKSYTSGNINFDRCFGGQNGPPRCQNLVEGLGLRPRRPSCTTVPMLLNCFCVWPGAYESPAKANTHLSTGADKWTPGETAPGTPTPCRKHRMVAHLCPQSGVSAETVVGQENAKQICCGGIENWIARGQLVSDWPWWAVVTYTRL